MPVCVSKMRNHSGTKHCNWLVGVCILSCFIDLYMQVSFLLVLLVFKCVCVCVCVLTKGGANSLALRCISCFLLTCSTSQPQGKILLHTSIKVWPISPSEHALTQVRHRPMFLRKTNCLGRSWLLSCCAMILLNSRNEQCGGALITMCMYTVSFHNTSREYIHTYISIY